MKKVWKIIPEEGKKYLGNPNSSTTLRDYMTELSFPAKVPPENVICSSKWDYPIVNLMSGQIRSCCKVPAQKVTDDDIEKYGTDIIQNLPYEKDRRRENLLGITHKDCESCLRSEWNGGSSVRTGMQDFVNNWLILKNEVYPTRVRDTTQWYIDHIPSSNEDLPNSHPLLESNKPRILELMLGNHCDLKCTYCNFHYSTQWQAEIIKFGEIKKEEITSHIPVAPSKLESVFWEWFYDVGRHSCEAINILGGEPTYMPKFYEMIEKLTAAYDDLGKRDRHIELGIITNLNTKKPQMDKFLSLLSEITKHLFVRLQPSMESLHKRAEYIRYGLSWDRFESNLRRILSERDQYNLSEYNFGLGMQSAVNVFSVSSLPQFVHWVNSLINEYKFDIGLMSNIVMDPRHHSPYILTQEYASYVDEAREYINIVAEKNDRQIIRLAERTGSVCYGSWSKYNSDTLDGIYRGLESDFRSDYDLESRKHWYEFVEKIKFRRNVDVLDFFPEMSNFYHLCKNM